MFSPTAYLDAVVGGILTGLTKWGAIVVFAAMFVDCLPFVAFVAPGVIMLVLTGFFAAGQPTLSWGLLFAAACAGVIASDTLMFYIGRSGYHRIPAVRRLVDKQERLRQAILNQRAIFLIFYQFPPYSRMFAPLVMGAARFSWIRWTALVSTSTVLFVASFFGIGLVAALGGRAASGATASANTISVIFAFAFFAWLSALIYRLMQRRRDQSDTP
jgi:membrane protein DedA with SNARE-associated domain